LWIRSTPFERNPTAAGIANDHFDAAPAEGNVPTDVQPPARRTKTSLPSNAIFAFVVPLLNLKTRHFAFGSPGAAGARPRRMKSPPLSSGRRFSMNASESRATRVGSPAASSMRHRGHGPASTGTLIADGTSVHRL